jgi:hypothetical protein
MTYEELVEIIKDLDIDEERKLQSSTFTFGLGCDEKFDEAVIIFGGYATHFSIWSLEYSSPEEIANGIVEHIKQYHSDVNEHITLEECEMV